MYIFQITSLKRQPHKMVKHTQTICRLLLKGLIQNMKQYKGSNEIH